MSPGSSLPSAAAASRTVASTSADETRALASRLAAVALPGDLLALTGDLGAGKTQFAKGFATGLGIEATVNSPSFVLMAEYAGRLPLFHLDLYRLADDVDAWSGGLLDDRQGEGGHARSNGPNVSAWPIPAARLGGATSRAPETSPGRSA